MKTPTYDKKAIMERAWEIFQNDNIWLSDLEQASYEEVKTGIKTFSICLKIAWREEKEIVERINAKRENAKDSIEVKAWNWAEKKLNVHFDIEAVDKMEFVQQEERYFNFSKSVWACAISALRLHIKHADVA